MERRCDQCGGQYDRPPSQIGRFCSKKCAYAERRKERTTHRRMRYLPGHPLSGATGLVADARVVLYEKIGPGDHVCHWCGREISWVTGTRGNQRGALVADHLDNDPLNDEPSNLVASCGACNGTRTQRVGDDETFVTIGSRRLRALERSCESCGKGFLSPKSEVAVGKGRFCSRSCARSKRKAT